ncbi:MAG: hypothetical protein K0S44_3120 [Bacteroidetes bacterium]|jgi:hypothetical protein|nr:hypothetical protein [Bacteroidota bacterium]
MKLKSYSYIIIVAISIIGLASCVSKKKYVETNKKLIQKDSFLVLETNRLNMLNDSLKWELASRDSIIDSLSVRLNETISRKAKTRSKTGNSIKKSTLSREQEYEKKSLFIYNFTKLIEWPIEYNGTEFKIGVVGDEFSMLHLRTFMAQKKVTGKKIIVEKYKKGARYQVIYITNSGMNSFENVKNSIKHNKTLLVTDHAAAGTHISFMMDEDKVRYTVEKDLIEKSGLKVGQELMRYSG